MAFWTSDRNRNHNPNARTVLALCGLAGVALTLAVRSHAAQPTPQALPAPGAARGMDAAALLGKIHDRYLRGAAFTLTFVQTYAPAGFSEVAPEGGTLILQPPESLRFTYNGREGKVYTFDGQKARQYVAQDRQMVVKALSLEEKERLPLLFMTGPERLLARYSAASTPIDAGEDKGQIELTLEPKAGGEPRRLTVRATTSGELRKLVVLDRAGNRTAFTFSKEESGPRRPASDFTLEPPPGTRIVSE